MVKIIDADAQAAVYCYTNHARGWDLDRVTNSSLFENFNNWMKKNFLRSEVRWLMVHLFNQLEIRHASEFETWLVSPVSTLLDEIDEITKNAPALEGSTEEVLYYISEVLK